MHPDHLERGCLQKHPYPSRKAARRALRWFWRHGRSDYAGAHAYRCQAGHWHIGHGLKVPRANA